eukprot:CAMPEP_0184517024 /NCGR_PEP_ID=MMETSP0198_2-20121128/5341_1 /TAXON_ID=1112570 /ORGANISM="Thraustochytrium sp., Strain LLF1b" /LENGTH=209 /DNA_ID=CAMNT_0026907383 /DNA_START=1532 /DNA_END=2158 /DNA_ORIENTATION=+
MSAPWCYLKWNAAGDEPGLARILSSKLGKGLTLLNQLDAEGRKSPPLEAGSDQSRKRPRTGATAAEVKRRRPRRIPISRDEEEVAKVRAELALQLRKLVHLFRNRLDADLTKTCDHLEMHIIPNPISERTRSRGGLPQTLDELNRQSQPALQPSSTGTSQGETDAQPWCVCRQAFSGGMIACESKSCEIEWFHFDCVGLDEAAPPTDPW